VLVSAGFQLFQFLTENDEHNKNLLIAAKVEHCALRIENGEEMMMEMEIVANDEWEEASMKGCL